MTSKIKVDNINKVSDDSNIINKCGTTITLGASGDSIALASGASQTGFGRTGTVDWDTTKKTASFTATNGDGFFVDSSSSAITVTLPASPSANDIVAVSDYNGSAETNAITVARNSSNINGNASDYVITKSDSAVTFVYVDATAGWTSVQTSNTLDNINAFIAATGGTETTCGDFKIHTFTGPGTFTVTNAGLSAGSNTVDYLVVAGGGAGASTYRSGGGGAGGVRFSATTYCEPSPATPLKAPVALPVSAQAYPITVGAGSVKQHISSPPDNTPERNPNGSPSTFSTIISAGGGSGGEYPAVRSGGPGGSGGGGNGNPAGPNAQAGGTGNTPPVSPPQGNTGGAGGLASDALPGTGGPARAGGGGGGALAAGSNVSPATNGDGGPGGNGITLNIIGSCSSYGGGGGGGAYTQPYPTGPANGGTGGAGGSGIVILRYPSTKTITVGAGLTSTTYTESPNKVTVFTAGTGNVSWA